ncbi:MAG TPA: TonB-dependent receptor, partial [Gammaproteobacteria bacterium]|nr:TonB-dependent receptor [Gammaproteobacteria bacterium]
MIQMYCGGRYKIIIAPVLCLFPTAIDKCQIYELFVRRLLTTCNKFFFMLSCFFIWQPRAFCAPLIIEINKGIEATPFETGDVDNTVSPSFVQIIKLSEARDSQLDLGDIIEKNSGVKIRRIGGIGGYSSVSIRGKSSDQVMVYVDGMLINQASGGSVDLSQIPLNQIVQIEIYKDVIPVEFSEAANGGVINIITHRATQRDASRLSVSAGSFGTLSLDTLQMKGYKKWTLVFSGGYLTSKNDFSFVNDKVTPENPYDDEVENRENNQLRQYNATLKARYYIDDLQSVEYQVALFNKLKHIPSMRNSPDTRASLLQEQLFFDANYLNKRAYINRLSLNINTKFG